MVIIIIPSLSMYARSYIDSLLANGSKQHLQTQLKIWNTIEKNENLKKKKKRERKRKEEMIEGV